MDLSLATKPETLAADKRRLTQMKAMQRPIIETKTSQAKLCPRKQPLTTPQFITIHHNFNTSSSASASSVLPGSIFKTKPIPKIGHPSKRQPAAGIQHPKPWTSMQIDKIYLCPAEVASPPPVFKLDLDFETERREKNEKPKPISASPNVGQPTHTKLQTKPNFPTGSQPRRRPSYTPATPARYKSESRHKAGRRYTYPPPPARHYTRPARVARRHYT